MQGIKLKTVKFYYLKLLFLILLIPPLSNGIISYRPYLLYKCIKVIDGDTIELKRNHRVFRVRLKYIDAPESHQLSLDKVPIGKNAKKHLEKIILNKRVKFKREEKGVYGRDIGVIFLNDNSINLMMIKSGMAITYGAQLPFAYRQAQYQARAKRVGVWRTEGFLNPSYYRKLN